MLSRPVDRARFGYYFVAPFFLVFVVFSLYPILYSFYLSLTSWDGFADPAYVGLQNWKRLFTDTLFYKSILNTFIIWVMSIVPQLILALVLALILNEKFIRGGISSGPCSISPTW